MVDDDIAERFKNFDQDQKVSIISQIYDYLVEGQLIFNKKLCQLITGQYCRSNNRPRVQSSRLGLFRPIRVELFHEFSSD